MRTLIGAADPPDPTHTESNSTELEQPNPTAMVTEFGSQGFGGGGGERAQLAASQDIGGQVAVQDRAYCHVAAGLIAPTLAYLCALSSFHWHRCK